MELELVLNKTENIPDPKTKPRPMNQNPPRYPKALPTMIPVIIGPAACPTSIIVFKKPMEDPEPDSMHRSETSATVEDVTEENPIP